MEKVVGIGGVFFKAKDSKALAQWYKDNLGIDVMEAFGGAIFRGEGKTVWTPFSADSKHFPGPLMINYRVKNLDAMLAQLREKGVSVDEKTDSSDFGKFGWGTDPEGNRFELWEPPAG